MLEEFDLFTGQKAEKPETDFTYLYPETFKFMKWFSDYGLVNLSQVELSLDPERFFALVNERIQEVQEGIKEEGYNN